MLIEGSPKGYMDIVGEISAAIIDGRLLPGDKLPPQRELAYQLGVAHGTVTKAYKVAEEKGHVASYVGRGTFALHPASLQSAGRFVKDSKDFGKLDLSLDEPLEAYNPDLKNMWSKVASHEIFSTLLDYDNPAHSQYFRGVASQWLSAYDLRVHPDKLVITEGSQHGIFAAFSTATSAGDTVGVEELCFPGARGVCDVLGLKTAALTCDEQGVTPDSLEEACQKFGIKVAYMTPSLQNPTNGQMSLKRRETIAEIAVKYGLMIIEDETRPRCAVSAPTSIASLIPDNVFFIAGLSKIIGGGLRRAILTAPERYFDRLETVVWGSIWGTSPITSALMAYLIESGEAERIAKLKTQQSNKRRELLDYVLGNYKVRCREGSTVAWLELPDTWTVAQIVGALRDKNIVVSPADVFWVGKGVPPNAIRLAVGAPRTLEQLKTGLETIAETLKHGPRLRYL